MITVIVPAHNEAVGIDETLKCLKSQTRRPDRVIVVADNCTDATEHLALAGGAEVLRTVGNSDKKAGALNFALSSLLPDTGPEDLILIQDADSQLSHDFVERGGGPPAEGLGSAPWEASSAAGTGAASWATCSGTNTPGTPGT